MKKQHVVDLILKTTRSDLKNAGSAFAPINIALCKYWGKRDTELNLPVTPSLSVSLQPLGTTTHITIAGGQDQVYLNGECKDSSSEFYKRISLFLSMFRPDADTFFTVRTENNVPTAAGLASSASGFAALVFALNDLFSWDLSRRYLSVLARLGSGSACRSVYQGFVKWRQGELSNGSDSYAEALNYTWPDLRIGVIEIATSEKCTSSRDAMKRTVDTSILYHAWPDKVERDMNLLIDAIKARDFEVLGRVSESNALAMHATMMDSWPPVIYWVPETVKTIHKIQEMRHSGIPIYFTIDAGPNIKILFLAEHEQQVRQSCSALTVLSPFAMNP